MNSRAIILTALDAADMTGYEIKKLCSEGSFSFFSDLSYGSIYPTLAQLEQDGCVTFIQEAQNGKPDRKIYSITDHGRRELQRELAVMQGPDKHKSTFCLLALSGSIIGHPRMAELIAQRMEEMRHAIAVLSETHNNCECTISRWLTGYGTHIMKSHLDYLQENGDKLLEAISNKALNPAQSNSDHNCSQDQGHEIDTSRLSQSH